MAAEMSRRLGDLPVHLDNDANLGALAEVTLGAARDARNAVYVMISSGIGAGLIVDGRLYRGGGGMAGEIGHVLVDETGPICRCGNRGCLETFISGPALTDLLRRSRGEVLSVHDIVRLAHGGDTGCQRAIADAGRVLGRVVAAICNIFNPDTVVVGGDLGEAGDVLLDPMREAVGRYAIAPAAEDARIVGGRPGRASRGARRARPCPVAVRASRGAPGAASVVHPTRRNHVKFKGRKQLVLGAAALALAVPVAACGSDNSGKSDSSSSSSSEGRATSPCCCRTRSRPSAGRRRPAVPEEAFDAAGVKSHDRQRRGRQVRPAAAGRAGDHERREGAAARRTSTPAPARRSPRTRKSQGVKVIDYDRLTLKGDSDYYVSFDNEKVGKLQGQGLVNCLEAATKASRSPRSTAPRPTTTRRCSRRATTRSLDPKYKDGTLKKGR